MNVQSRIEPPHDLDIAAFFDWAERQVERYELVRGRPRLLPWVQFDHNRIVVNLTRLFSIGLDPDAYEVATGDFALKVGPDSIRYADLMIVPAGKPGDIRFVDDACLVIEVLSRSTMKVDFGEKLAEYQALDGVRTYVIFAQKPAEAWAWSRGTDGRWPSEPQIFTRLSQTIDIAELGMRIPLSEVYRNVV